VDRFIKTIAIEEGKRKRGEIIQKGLYIYGERDI
jgi:hypothetical protein